MRQIPTLTLFAATLLLSSCYATRKSNGGGQTTGIPDRAIDAADIALPQGYRITAVASGLTFPSAATVDDKGQLYVIETGYSYGEIFGLPKLIRVGADGGKTTVATGPNNGPWTSILWYEGNFYVSEGGEREGGRILRISPSGEMKTLVDGLPSFGDHHTDALVVKDNYIYFGQGTATNSAVVGPDNKEYGWLKRKPGFHDVPCNDITLAGVNYSSPDVLGDEKREVSTGAFMPFGTASKPGQVIKGKLPCTGAIMRIPLEGGPVELVASGLRNPYGVSLAPDGKIYTTENAYDDRGSRPVWGAGDVLWEVKTGAWYGFPDYSAGMPMAGKEQFKVPGKEPVKALLQHYPATPPKPVAILGVHASANGLDFSSNPAFGYTGEAFVAEFGDMAPKVGKVMQPVGYKIVRVNVETGVIADFAVNRGRKNGPASWHKRGGLERPLSVRFDPSGKALYVVDFGIIRMTEAGPQPQQGSGVVWKITKD
jgi:glucose/arabinose dehydrogenase